MRIERIPLVLLISYLFVGSAWSQTWTNHTLYYKGAAILSNGAIGIASSDGYYQLTTNSGKNWVQTTRLPSYNTFFNITKLFPYSKDTLYAYNDYKLIRSTNGGYNWNSLTAPGVSYIYGYVFFDDTSGVSIGSVGAGNPRIYRTSNGANSWLQITATSLNFRGIEKLNDTS
ncbi:MAG: hypothetical protein K2Q22_04845, partial [Cytophagales bacterium]|nr:hypothetical protein [Cytophagales bacterium]